MRNIIANAVKFTPQDGKITIDATMTGDFWQIEIQDTGFGMSDAEIEQLFNIKTHFTKQGTEGEKGSGLGLLLCKEFVENNGGKIWIKSQIKKGTSFFFTLPIG